MPDNLKKRHPQDGKRINPNQRHEVRDWCRKFGCTEEELAQAVADVGDSADAVKRRLQGRIGLTGPEVRYWCEKFECTEDELRAAVEAAGTTLADDVEVEIPRIKARRLRPFRSRSSDSGWSR